MVAFGFKQGDQQTVIIQLTLLLSNPGNRRPKTLLAAGSVSGHNFFETREKYFPRWQKQIRPIRMPGDEQKGKGLVWPVTATNEHRNMRGYQESDLLDLLVVGESFGPKQQAKTAASYARMAAARCSPWRLVLPVPSH